MDMGKVEADARFDGNWVLQTNATFSAERVALKCKGLP